MDIITIYGHNYDVGHFYEAMILRPLRPGLELHTPGSLLHGHDVDGMFDSFRADHGDRWEEGALWEVAPGGTFVTFFYACKSRNRHFLFYEIDVFSSGKREKSRADFYQIIKK